MKNETYVRIYLGRLTCSTSEREEVLSNPKEIPGFKFCKRLKRPGKGFEKVAPESAVFFEKYMEKAKFCNGRTVLKVFSKRRDKHSPMPPLVLIFQPFNGNFVSCKEVFSVRDHFLKEHNLPLRPDEIQLVVEIQALKGTGIHDMVTRSIIAGKTRRPYHRVGKHWIFDTDSPSRVALTYRATRDCIGPRCYVNYDCSVIKMRVELDHLKDRPTTIEELAVHDWSDVYGECFALLEPTELLKKHDECKTMPNAPIWDLEECMETRHGIPPSDFYRDCVRDHPFLSVLVRHALLKYRWCPDPDYWG